MSTLTEQKRCLELFLSDDPADEAEFDALCARAAAEVEVEDHVVFERRREAAKRGDAETVDAINELLAEQGVEPDSTELALDYLHGPYPGIEL